METSDSPTIETELGEEIYRYVERHGTAARHRVRDITAIGAEEFEDELGRLKSRGYLEGVGD